MGRNPAGRSQSSIFSDPCSGSPALASPAPRDVLSEGRVSARMSIMVPDTCSPLPEVVDSLPRDSLCHWRLKKGTKLISESATSEVLLSPTFLDCTEDVCPALPSQQMTSMALMDTGTVRTQGHFLVPQTDQQESAHGEGLMWVPTPHSLSLKGPSGRAG